MACCYEGLWMIIKKNNKKKLQKVRTKNTLLCIWKTICKECDQRRQVKARLRLKETELINNNFVENRTLPVLELVKGSKQEVVSSVSGIKISDETIEMAMREC